MPLETGSQLRIYTTAPAAPICSPTIRQPCWVSTAMMRGTPLRGNDLRRVPVAMLSTVSVPLVPSFVRLLTKAWPRPLSTSTFCRCPATGIVVTPTSVSETPRTVMTLNAVAKQAMPIPAHRFRKIASLDRQKHHWPFRSVQDESHQAPRGITDVGWGRNRGRLVAAIRARLRASGGEHGRTRLMVSRKRPCSENADIA